MDQYFFKMKWFQLTSIFIIIDVSTTQMDFPMEPPSKYYAISSMPQYAVDPLLNKEIFKLGIYLSQFYQTNEADKGSHVFAPVNIAATLSLVLLGAQGKTFNELANVLGLPPNFMNQSHLFHEKMANILQTIGDSTGFGLGDEVKLASALFVQDDYPIRNIYREISRNLYRSEAYNVNFREPEAAQKIVNEWVNENTNTKISTILDEPLNPETKVIIAGVLYFKAAWEKPFNVDATIRKPFYTNGRKTDSTTIVDMMSNGGHFPYYHDTNLDCEILGLPFKGSKTTMFVIMPKNSNKEKLKRLQSKLTPDDLERLITSTTSRTCVIAFPKMRLESFYKLDTPLRTFGVNSLFSSTQANIGILSPGDMSSDAPIKFESDSLNPDQNHGYDSVIIFPRFGSDKNCTEIFDPTTNITKCEDVDEATNRKVVYKKFDNKVGRRIVRQTNPGESLDYLRASLPESENPGLFVTDVFHKVYIDITEKGTEAAAATSTSIGRGGDIVVFKADTPFLFFIWNHDAQVVLFWGAVNTPTPSYS